jgi:cation diffusion facilitator CzcD-associated flavoprotein CzcO
VQRLAELHLRWQIADPEMRRKLTPDYTMGCKRILISNRWYPAFNRDNVALVTAPIAEVRPRSVVTADGAEHPADCLIFGTGFVVDPREYLRDLPIVGRGGRSLMDAWRVTPEAYLGTVVPEFPNLFMLIGPNTGLGHNSMIFMMEAQFRYILSCLDLLDGEGAATLEVRRDVTDAYNAGLRAAFGRTVWASGCHSWYLQDDGRNPTLWPHPTWRYWLRTRRARAGDFRLGAAAGAHR